MLLTPSSSRIYYSNRVSRSPTVPTPFPRPHALPSPIHSFGPSPSSSSFHPFPLPALLLSLPRLSRFGFSSVSDARWSLTRCCWGGVDAAKVLRLPLSPSTLPTPTFRKEPVLSQKRRRGAAPVPAAVPSRPRELRVPRLLLSFITSVCGPATGLLLIQIQSNADATVGFRLLMSFSYCCWHCGAVREEEEGSAENEDEGAGVLPAAAPGLEHRHGPRARQ